MKEKLIEGIGRLLDRAWRGMFMGIGLATLVQLVKDDEVRPWWMFAACGFLIIHSIYPEKEVK